jgi:putative ABC transport system permease protein
MIPLISRRVPLAWLNLTFEKRRLLASLAGVSFAILLMLMQLGFYRALLDNQLALIEMFNADLVIVNRLKYTLVTSMPFSPRRIYQARTAQDVESVYPIYLESESSRLQAFPKQTSRPVRVIAFNPDDPALKIPGISEMSAHLKLPETALFDSKSRPYWGSFRPGLRGELEGQRLKIIGNFELGPDLVTDGNLIMGEDNFIRYFPWQRSQGMNQAQVELGLVKLKVGGSLAAAKLSLNQLLPTDVVTMTIAEFRDKEVQFWKNNTPMGYAFGLGVVLGFVIGTVICYQILFSDIHEQLPQFATLKAIGYTNASLAVIVMQQSAYLALLAALPALIICWMLQKIVSQLTHLSLSMSLVETSTVIGVALIMSLLAGGVALRHVLSTDPAEVFQ